MTTHFQENTVVLYMNEFIDLHQPASSITITPYTPEKPKAWARGKKVIVQLQNALKPQTTYQIRFNQAIKDFNEGNILNEYSLIFSTGSSIDSGKLQVKTADAKTKKTSDLTRVCLVKKKSDFYGKNYGYVADAVAGLAQFSTLTKEPFYVFAFIDSNRNMTWEKTEAIAFLKDPIDYRTGSIELSLSSTKQAKTNFIVQANSLTEFNVSATQDLDFPMLEDTGAVLEILGPRTLRIITKLGGFTQKLKLVYDKDKRETLELPVSKQIKGLERLPMQDERLSMVVRPDTLWLPYNGYITGVDAGKIKLLQDDVPIQPILWVRENKVGIINLQPGKKYQLAIDSLAIRSALRTNSKQDLSFTTYAEDKIHKDIVLTLEPAVASHRFLKLFHLDQGRWIAIPKQAKIAFNTLYGEELKIVLVEDLNNDGMWTAGDITKELQPERMSIQTLKLDPKQKEYILKMNL